MRRRAFLVIVLTGSGLVVGLSGLVASYSDGTAGNSGAIPEHLRVCADPDPSDDEPGYCKVRVAYCGGCHAQHDDMMEPSEEHGYSTPQERTRPTFALNDDEAAGTVNGLWEYTPGGLYRLDFTLPDTRPPGTFNSGAFNLNASGGRLAKLDPSDPNVRITGGVFQHAGTKNPQFWAGEERYGSHEIDESEWAGEATQTAQGAEVRSWSVRWTAPASGVKPKGIAFVMTGMLPNNDGINTECTYEQCNESRARTSQDEWDWYGFMVPRRILCERGAYESFRDCQEAVIDFILPPPPPLATDCPDADPRCATATDGETLRETPGLGAASLVTAALAVVLRRRSRPPRHR